jgi:hypothetical protein
LRLCMTETKQKAHIPYYLIFCACILDTLIIDL